MSYGYDSLCRLHTLGINLAGTSTGLILTFGYNLDGVPVSIDSAP